MVKVGGEVDSYCTRCELTLAHTVHAVVGGHPVKVECNTCHGVHRYRGAPGAKPVKTVGNRPAAARSLVEKKTTISFDELLRKRDLASAARYSPKSTYRVDQVIEHPTFGLGFVSAIRDAQKIEVTFRTDVKVLVQGKP
jgi:hypothetical protein